MTFSFLALVTEWHVMPFTDKGKMRTRLGIMGRCRSRVHFRHINFKFFSETFKWKY